jgi:hypothetical protein
VEAVIAIVLVVLAIGCLVAMFDVTRHPDRWRAVRSQRVGRRAILWTMALAGAAAVGAALGGAGTLAAAVVVCGVVLVVVELRCLFWARLYDRPRPW